MTSAPETVHVDVVLNLPTEDGTTLRVRQGIGGIKTQTEGLVVFPALIGPFDIDDSRWNVTHISTGRRIPITFPDEGSATRFANSIGDLADWAADRPKVPVAKVVQAGVALGGVPDQRVADALARRDAKTEPSA